MEDHVCFKCTECIKRKVDEFYETNCLHFPAVKQQVVGNVTECEMFIPVAEEKGKQ